MLASFPRSGSTWLRYLLQQATGIYTGTIYPDERSCLLDHGFLNEPVYDKSVLMVKTHLLDHPENLDRAIILIRDPFEAIVSYYNYKISGMMGCAPAKAYHTDGGVRWKNFVYESIEEWRTFYLNWYNKFPAPGTRYILFYEDLVHNTEDLLYEILSYLTVPKEETTIECALCRKEGIHHRQKQKIDIQLFDSAMNKTISRIRKEVFRTLHLSTHSKQLKL